MDGFGKNFTSGMNYLRRRFSSGDLQGELLDEEEKAAQMPQSVFGYKKGPSPSAPSSPSKNMQQSMQGMTAGMPASVQGLTRGLFGPQKPAYNKDRCKTLLVIDDQHTDWCVPKIHVCFHLNPPDAMPV